MNLNYYVKKDISEKKILLDVFPKNTEKRLTKYRNTLEEITSKYTNIKEAMQKYIDYKYSKMIPTPTVKNELVELREKEEKYFKLYKLLNKDSRFYEEFGMDLLFYKLELYYNNTIKENNDIIKEIISILESFNIKVSLEDFDFNIYAKYYMKFFFDTNNSEEENLSIHVDCYWKCPKVFIYILVSLKIIIWKNEKKIIGMAKKIANNTLKTEGISNVLALNDKYSLLAKEINRASEDSEEDLILKCYNGEIDLELLTYTRESLEKSFDYFVINKFDITEAEVTNKYVLQIVELKNNMEEYLAFLKNKTLFDFFDKKYKKYVLEKNDTNLMSEYNTKKNDISKKIKKVISMKMNKSLVTIDDELNEKEKNSLFEQGVLIEELYNDYKNLDDFYYDMILKKNLKASTTASDILYFIVNYPSYGYNVIKSVFKFDLEKDVEDKYKELRSLYYSPDKKIMDMFLVFMKDDLKQILINGYRFGNIDITEESFDEVNCGEIIKECDKLILKVKASNFKTPIENIRFIVNVKELKDAKRL